MKKYFNAFRNETSMWILILFLTLIWEANAEEEFVVPKEQKMAVMLITGMDTTGAKSSGSGFACTYKDREFVATNLHVVENASVITVTPQSGNAIELSGQIIVAEDADICFLGIKGKFGELGIVPLEFMADVFKESAAGDEIICLGNSLGNGVITATKGKIKAYGQPAIEIDAPVVQGNSGGPIIHKNTGKVLGLVTEAIINQSKFNPLAEAATKSKNSTLKEISYFGHRVDVTKKWKGVKLSEFIKASQSIAQAEKNLDNIYKFLVEEPGWRDDKNLAEAWDNYEKFIDVADSKTTRRRETTEYVNELGVVVGRTSKIKGKNVSEGDYNKAKQTFIRALESRVLAAKDVVDKTSPLGYRQIEAINQLKEDSKHIAEAVSKQ
jgi:Trypsin-like peptidase domain